MAAKARVRLIDIAERLNLSKVSVSKALRDHPDISRETRDLIKKTAAEMGYVPNMLARSLSSQRSWMIGVVVPKIAHVFFSNALDGIIDRAGSEGYEVVVTISQEQSQLETKHLETLLSMHVDGILVSVSEDKEDAAVYDRVRQMGVPLVFFDRTPDGQDFSSVRVDDDGGAYAGVSRVIGEGANVVAHLAGYQYTNIGRDRRAGYERALRDHGIEPREEWVVEGGFSEVYGYSGYKQLHERGVRPDAVFCATFPVAIGMVMAMREIDADPEHSTKIIAFDTGGMRRLTAFPYYCIRQDAFGLGSRAAGELLRIITDDDAEPQQITLPTEVFGPQEFIDDDLSWLPEKSAVQQ